MQEKNAHLFQIFVTRVLAASRCERRDQVETWIGGLDPAVDFTGKTLEQMQQMDIRDAVGEVECKYQEVREVSACERVPASLDCGD